MNKTTPKQNKAVILEVVTTAVNRKDFAALDKYVHPGYAQHNPLIPGGRDGVRGFWASLPDAARYEPAAIIVEGDLVMVHGRYSGVTDKPLLSVDIFQFRDGQMVAHWDVVQEEVPAEQATSGLPMFPTPQPGPA
jgi:predicted SnoaL-like aldol condensation-catalyzing enzyme